MDVPCDSLDMSYKHNGWYAGSVLSGSAAKWSSTVRSAGPQRLHAGGDSYYLRSVSKAYVLQAISAVVEAIGTSCMLHRERLD